MSIRGVVDIRGIVEILHFTTNHGLIGILDIHAVLPRNSLSTEQRLRHILKLNSNRVLDLAWKSYVHLSISHINSTLFDISSNKWHPDVWWPILSFDPVIMEHPGVYFTTTNNAYPSVLRGEGAEALARVFAPEVRGRYDALVRRPADMPPMLPTCLQAEMLYPGALSTDFLRAIYVKTGEEQDDVWGLIDGVKHPRCNVIVAPEKFGTWGG